MAEFALEEVFSNSLTISGNATNLDCAVCLQTCIHPAELPCGHIFCYLCIKGIVNQGRRCAMCRQEIPVDYLDKPRLLKPMDAEITSQGFEDGHLWFYEGHNGWWQYDDRTSVELESAYQKGERCCELLIAGFLYIIDFDGMLQYRRNDPSRRRRIKRDIATTSKKGIAGLKTTKNCNSVVSNPSANELSETNENSSGSDSSAQNNLGSLRNINGSVNSAQQTEPILGHQRMGGRNIPGCSFPFCRNASAVNSDRIFVETDSANYDLGSTVVLTNTLDWAIEQIESLNLELLNDYETIFRDYGHSESDLSQSRHRRTSSNNLNRCPIMSSSLNESSENDLELSREVLGSSDSVDPILPVTPSSSPIRSSSISSDTSEAETQSLQSISNPPQPPPRSRGMPRSRSRREFTPRSSSLNCDKFFQRFVSKK